MLSSDPQPQRTAVIDLGSNSARVIVMKGVPGYNFHLEDEIREIVRLREGMTARGLSDAAIQRGLLTLKLFKRYCDSVRADHLIATATSAVREAANGHEFLGRVQEETGLELRILDGGEEAYYGVIGALNALTLQRGVVVDIGGGSAQVSQVRERRFVQGQALTLGALALTERFVRSDPPKKSEVRAVQDEINRQLDGVTWLAGERGSTLAGLGGTIRTLAKIQTARGPYPLQSINGLSLSRDGLDETISQLRAMPLSGRKKIRGIVSDRADILLPGALVIRSVMERLQSDALISENGLREGLFFERFWAELPYPVAPDLREFSALNMARFYGFHEAHTAHVRHLATRLFDQLAPLHGMGALEREWLSAAALLHDIGTAVRYNDHHRHSQTLITSSGLPGYSPREVAMIALLARFHRKGTPAPGEYAPLMQPGDDARLLQLSALLRLSEYLERGRNGIVRDIRALWDAKLLRLLIRADDDPAVELWDAQRNGLDLFPAAFGRSVELGAE